MKHASPNLWSVTYSTQYGEADTKLWILASSAAIASAKAKRFLKKNGERGAKVTAISHEGTIDVF